MKGTINCVPHPDTKVTIELEMTYKETKDLLTAVSKTSYYPIGKLQNILELAVKEVFERLSLEKITDGETYGL